MTISLEKAIEILNDSANGTTCFDDEYTEACKMAVELMVMVKIGKVIVKFGNDINPIGGVTIDR